MKKNLFKSIKLLFACLAFSSVNAQTAATATWTLSAAPPSATVTGSITATDQTLGSSIGGYTYGSGYTIGGATVSGWQRCATSPNLPTTYDANSYVDYKVTPSGGQHFTMTMFEAELLGGGSGLVKVALYWSVDNFATSQLVGTCSYNSVTVAGSTDAPVALINSGSSPAAGAQQLTVPTFIPVTPSQTLTIRLYAWCGSANKYLASKNIKITGVTSAASLPLSLRSFSVSSQNEKPTLNWITTNEVNVKSFEIEKSADGNTFKTLASINANNTTSNIYSYTDNEFAKQSSYYRLKIVDRDGKFFYSYVVNYSVKAKAEFMAYPNPATGVISIKHPIITSDKAVICIYGVDGKLLKQISPASNTRQSFIDISTLKAGSYIVALIDNATSMVTKISKN